MCAATSPEEPLLEQSGVSISGSVERELTVIRIAWAAVALVCVGLFIAALPLRLAELTHLVAATNTPRIDGVVFAPEVYVGCAFALELLGPLVFLTLALLIVWRRSDDSGAIRISALLIAFGSALPGTAYAIISATPIWRVTPGALQAIGWTALLIFAYLFPDGQWTPRRSRLVVPLWALWTTSFFVFAEQLTAGRLLLIAAAYLIWVIWLGTGVCAQVYRYLRVATPTQRQQSKWVLLGFAGALVGILLVSARDILALSQGQVISHNALDMTLALVVLTLSALPIPISIAIAILRHNLYSIDRLINLTLVYGSLSVTLGALYTAAVSLSQYLIQAITGQQGQSQLALALSTLGVAALFQPLRRRIQAEIDRQFYRRRYDAAQTIAAFSASLRTEMDLSEISQRLVRVVHHTMKPRHVSLWLAHPPARPPDEYNPIAQESDEPRGTT